MRMRLHIGCAVLLIPAMGFAQVHVDRPILLNGAGSEQRQVIGLAPSTAPGDVLTAGVSQSGALQFLPGMIGNAWVATIPGTTATLRSGLHVVIKAPTTSEGAVTIVLNGQGPFVLQRGTETVDGATLQEGTMLSLIFDGVAMQLINGRNDLRRNCPNGMVSVSEQYCIEPGQRAAADFFNAAVTCASAGRRLCSWAEFNVACVNTGQLGLTSMEDNWEWSNNTANEDGNVRVVGQGTCFSAGTWPSTGSAPLQYRCCYSR